MHFQKQILMNTSQKIVPLKKRFNGQISLGNITYFILLLEFQIFLEDLAKIS